MWEERRERSWQEEEKKGASPSIIGLPLNSVAKDSNLDYTTTYSVKGTDKGLSVLANCETALLIEQPLFVFFLHTQHQACNGGWHSNTASAHGKVSKWISPPAQDH